MSKLKPGTKLEVKVTLKAMSGCLYTPGMVLELLELTDDAPFGFHSPLGNWRVKCPFMTSVWSSIWLSVDQGWMKIME